MHVRGTLKIQLAAVTAMLSLLLTGCSVTGNTYPNSPRSGNATLVRETPDVEPRTRAVASQASTEYLRLIENAEGKLASGDYEEAERIFKQALDRDDNAVDAYVGLGIISTQRRQLTPAEHYLGQAIKHDPDHAIALGYMGVLRDLQQSFEQAEYYHSSATRIDPDNPTLLNNYGFSLLMQGKPVEAETMIRRALAQSDAESDRVINNLVIALARQARYDEALELQLKTADRVTALNNIGYIAMMNVDYDIAERLFNEAIAEGPDGHAPAERNLERLKALMAELSESR